MLRIGLIREGKIPADNRVALSPRQCLILQQWYPDLEVWVQPSPHRCFSDKEYAAAGLHLAENLQNCDILLGIKEVPVDQLLPNKTYLFFSHTKKKQPHNQPLIRAMIDKRITLIDYECLEHPDGQRIIGFGFFAGIVGAHNGMMAFGERTGSFSLGRVSAVEDYRELIHTYFGLKLPPLKVAVTGSGRVAHGILEIMNLMDIQEVEPDEFLERTFSYPVYVHLKGQDLYRHRLHRHYRRDEFHTQPAAYECLFRPYAFQSDILLNGIYWEEPIPRLFTWEDLADPAFRIRTIADITDDALGSVPCNLGDAPPQQPVYGVDRVSRMKTAPYLPGSVDVMAVGNLPNELPRDASRYFGEQLLKYLLEDLRNGDSAILQQATILRHGQLTPHFGYLRDYAFGKDT